MKKVLFVSFVLLSSCQMLIKGGSFNDGGRIQPTPPANYPPANYPLTEFRDNRGCDYILAGDDRTRPMWVPLVTVSGSHICGGESVEYNVGAGVRDIHGTLNAPSPAPAPAPTPAPSAERPQNSGGIMGFISSLFGGSSEAEQPAAPAEQEIVIYEDQITRQPGTSVQTGEVDVISVPTQGVIPAPQPTTPSVIATPAPVAQPTQQIIAPAPVANPNLAVQVGTFPIGRGREVMAQLRQLGYQTRMVDLDSAMVVQVIPQAGQSTQALQTAMRSLGFSEAILVGITR